MNDIPEAISTTEGRIYSFPWISDSAARSRSETRARTTRFADVQNGFRYSDAIRDFQGRAWPQSCKRRMRPLPVYRGASISEPTCSANQRVLRKRLVEFGGKFDRQSDHRLESPPRRAVGSFSASIPSKQRGNPRPSACNLGLTPCGVTQFRLRPPRRSWSGLSSADCHGQRMASTTHTRRRHRPPESGTSVPTPGDIRTARGSTLWGRQSPSSKT